MCRVRAGVNTPAGRKSLSGGALPPALGRSAFSAVRCRRRIDAAFAARGSDGHGVASGSYGSSPLVDAAD